VTGYLKRGWNATFCIVALLHLSLCWCPAYSALAFLRPLLLAAKSRSLGHTVATILKTLPKARDVTLLFITIILLYAGIGKLLFRHIYTVDTCQTAGLSDGEHSQFDHVGGAILALFVLSTTENYPDVMYPAYHSAEYQDRDKHWIVVVYFGSFLILVLFLIMPLLLAVIYEQWKEVHRRDSTQNRILAYQALIAAYHVLLEDGERRLDMGLWLKLIKALQPRRARKEAAYMFMFLDSDKSGSVGIREFITGMCDVLRFNFKRALPPRPRPPNFFTSMLSYFEFILSYEELLHIVWSWGFDYCVKALNVAYALVFVWPTTEPHSAANQTVIFQVLVFAMALEQLLLLLVIGPRPLLQRRPGKSFDLLLVAVGVAAELTTSPPVQWSLRSFMVLRLLLVFSTMRELVATVRMVLRPIFMFIVSFFCLTYVYAAFGTLVFVAVPDTCENPGNATQCSNDQCSNQIAPGGLYVCSQTVNMKPFGWALLNLFQVGTTNNWNSLMYPTINALDPENRWGKVMTGVYFSSFFIMISYVCTSILTALVIDAFTINHERRLKLAATAQTQPRGGAFPNHQFPGPGGGAANVGMGTTAQMAGQYNWQKTTTSDNAQWKGGAHEAYSEESMGGMPEVSLTEEQILTQKWRKFREKTQWHLVGGVSLGDETNDGEQLTEESMVLLREKVDKLERELEKECARNVTSRRENEAMTTISLLAA